MKQCPECDEVFDNQKAYCDMDGSVLVKLTDSPRAISQTNTPAGATPLWMTGVIGGLIGIIVCVLLYIAFLAPSRDTAQQDRRTNQNTETTPVKTNQLAVVPNLQLPPAETASPVDSPAEAEASPAASPVAPATTAPPAALNNGPIATGGKPVANGEHAIIKMKDGSSVEADAAWEDSQGIWFRRSGVVSFLDKSRVEAITEQPQKRPAAAETKSP
jgi:predicted lipid-binding transport protein (Tim44 family)